MQLLVIILGNKQLALPKEDNALSLVRFRVGSKVGHGCYDIKGMKETKASILRQHVFMTYYSKHHF